MVNLSLSLSLDVSVGVSPARLFAWKELVTERVISRKFYRGLVVGARREGKPRARVVGRTWLNPAR